MASRRLAKELELVSSKFDAECVNDNLAKWQVALPGPDSTPYFGGTFLIELTFPEEYPFRAPEARFQTKIYHPNINHHGEVCLASIKNDWVPAFSAMTILTKIIELLKLPDPDDPLVPEIAIIYKQDLGKYSIIAEKWTHQHAM